MEYHHIEYLVTNADSVILCIKQRAIIQGTILLFDLETRLFHALAWLFLFKNPRESSAAAESVLGGCPNKKRNAIAHQPLELPSLNRRLPPPGMGSKFMTNL